MGELEKWVCARSTASISPIHTRPARIPTKNQGRSGVHLTTKLVRKLTKRAISELLLMTLLINELNFQF